MAPDVRSADSGIGGLPRLPNFVHDLSALLTICLVVASLTARDVTTGSWAIAGLALVVGAVLVACLPHRRRAVMRAVPAFVALFGGLIAWRLVIAGATWELGLSLWSVAMGPIVSAAIVLASERVRALVSLLGLWQRALSWMAALVLTALFLAWCGSSAHTITTAITSTRRVKSDTSPGAGRFPAGDSRCTAGLSNTAIRPDGIHEVYWEKLLAVAEDRIEWGLCRVGPIAEGPNGLIDVKVFSRTSGPEGHILIQRDIDGYLRSSFVKPQAGQLYYQQPGGEPLVNWGLPDGDIRCGSGRLVVFRGYDRSIVGISRWSGAIEPNTRGNLAAWYTPVSVVLPLVTELENRGLALEPARGPIVDAPTSSATQNFTRQISIRSDDPTRGSLNTPRLVERCRAAS